MKDIKLLLKQTREAISNKDYQTSMKLAKSVLREDKTNYMALIFLGISLKEIGPIDQAPKAFKKAIELNPSNVLAWQGLANYYENVDCEGRNGELLKCYVSIVNLETNENKLAEYCQKIANLPYENSIEIGNLLYDTSKKCNGENKYLILKILEEFFAKEKKISDELHQIYESCVLELINGNCISIKLYSEYLSFLHEHNRSDLFQEAEKMHILFPTDVTPLSWICKIYNELFVMENTTYENYEKQIDEYTDKLFKIDSSNVMGIFTQSIRLFQNNSIMEAKEKIMNVTIQRPGLVSAWIFSTDIFLKLGLISDAWISWKSANKLLQSVNHTKQVLKDKLICQQIELLAKSFKEEDWVSAVDLYNQHSNTNSFLRKSMVTIIKTKINLSKFAEAKLMISELADEESCHLLKLYLLRRQNQYKSALDLCENHQHDFTDWWIEKGLVHFHFEDYPRCLESFLRAVKCDQSNYLCFLHLGEYYKKVNNLDKARKCLERAFRLNPKSSQVGIMLSQIYRLLKNWEANLNLLESVSQHQINNDNKWAWLQLGLTYLEQGNPEKAIENLRFVVRIDPENSHCWESLADAYTERGAYTSALKCYQKSLELSESSLYPSFQVASIKSILGEYAEAKTDFEEILVSNPNYIPALKGLAETNFHLAKQCFTDQRLGTARDYAQAAVSNLGIAIKQRNDLSSLWKLLADCCFFVAKLPEKYSCLHASTDKTERDKIFDNEDLFEFATNCYCRAISLCKDDLFLWHDLGTCYMVHSRTTTDEKKKQTLLNYALHVGRHCATLGATTWQHWNLLGNAAMSENFALAQHCFIKAVIADHNSCASWNNLGVFYLTLGDIKLANKAFSEGQRSNPNYVNSWIGQALIAELLGNKEAMDLFRHSTQLGHHQQGGLGYGHWVCQLLLTGDSKDIARSVYKMNGLPVACDAINWYLERNEEDGCAWNIFGIINERLGLNKTCKEAFRKAYRLSEKEHRDKAKTNYARSLYHDGCYSQAIEVFKDISEASFSSGSGLALTLLRNQNYQEAYTVYEQALHWLTDEETYQSDLLVALGSIAYKFKGPDAAKTLLFQSIQLNPPSVWSLYSTFSLGLLHNDIKLSELVLNEFKKLEFNWKHAQKEYSDFIKHYSILITYFYLIKNMHKRAIVELSKLVHRHPDEGAVWLTLAQLMVLLQNSEKRVIAAVDCTDAVLKLGRSNMDVSKVLCLATLASVIVKDFKVAKIYAQKAVHLHPHISENWAVFLVTLSKTTEKILPSKHFRNLFTSMSCSESLRTWSGMFLQS